MYGKKTFAFHFSFKSCQNLGSPWVQCNSPTHLHVCCARRVIRKTAGKTGSASVNDVFYRMMFRAYSNRNILFLQEHSLLVPICSRSAHWCCVIKQKGEMEIAQTQRLWGAEATSEQSQRSAVGRTPRGETKEVSRSSWNESLREGPRQRGKCFCESLPAALEGRWEHTGLVLAFFHNLDCGGIQLQDLSPWRHNSFEVDWQKANGLPSHADPALASLLLLRTSCLASAQQWFHCCLLNPLPCSSFSSLHLHRHCTEQDLAMKPEGEAAKPFSCLDFRPNLHLLQILGAKMAPRLVAPEFRISRSYGRMIWTKGPLMKKQNQPAPGTCLISLTW